MNNSESTLHSTIEKNSESEISTPELADNSMGEFYQLRNNLLMGTIFVALVGSSLTLFFYDWQTSLNYLLGTCFGLVYLNMLARSVERVGLTKKTSGWSRLAIFIGLMIVAIKREQLQVVPVFLGFITYKVAILSYLLPLNLWDQQNKAESKN